MTTSDKTLLNQRRASHNAALETLKAPSCKLSGLQIWRELRGIELYLQSRSEEFSMGAISGEEWEAAIEECRGKITSIFGHLPEGVFISGDPRGHAIKLDCDVVPDGIEKDWGGYGILAATID